MSGPTTDPLSPFPQAETRAQRMALEDRHIAFHDSRRRFSIGNRPVIRWIKGEGLDDEITRAAIAQATDLFGDQVDYCLCTNGIPAARARAILAWASQPVEWWPLEPHDNPELAQVLQAAGCPPEKFGYWWKWFPQRTRPDAPEWILDGDMVVTRKPAWFEQWARGQDVCRVTQDDAWPFDQLYGRYSGHVDPSLRLYSGLVSLRPGQHYVAAMLDVIRRQPLHVPHNGRRDMCEQGVVAAAFQAMGVEPIPLHEFPFARAFQAQLDHGVAGDQGAAWGYHFGHSFRRLNPHFHVLMSRGVIPGLVRATRPGDEFAWLGNAGQWGVPGWSALGAESVALLLSQALPYVGRPVLELGTSRGRLSGPLAAMGCLLTTVDHLDRGAGQNLHGLGAEVVVRDAVEFLQTTDRSWPFIVVDLHDNSPAAWKRRIGPLLSRLQRPGRLFINNINLNRVPGWEEETGGEWLLQNLPAGYNWITYAVAQGIAIFEYPE